MAVSLCKNLDPLVSDIIGRLLGVICDGWILSGFVLVRD